MRHNIKFSPEFEASFDGTADQLTHIITNIHELLSSGGILENNASSILYGNSSYDKIISINI